MTALMTLALSNLVVAAALALAAWSAGRWLRRPALAHGLWLLVFLKLLTPPLVAIPVIRTTPPAVAAQPAVPNDAAPAALAPFPVDDAADGARLPANDAHPQVIAADAVHQDPPAPEQQPAELPNERMAPAPLAAAPAAPVEPAAAAATSLDWSWLSTAFGWVWLSGAVMWLSLAGCRLLRFQRLLRYGTPAPAELRRLAKGVARRMEVRCPRLVLVPGTVSPMLWAFGRRPRLVVPAALVERLTPEQWRTLLAHELAHWRRRDHWVRWLELATLAAYWWCPLVWWARYELQQAEEECCDAWVTSTLPGAARAYALALVETVDFLSGARAPLPPAASGLGHVHFLRRRLTMILRGRTPRALTLTGLLVVLTLGLVLLPLAPTWSQEAPAVAGQDRQAAVTRQDDKKEDKGEKKPDEIDPDKARRELQKLQEEFIKLQRQMEQKRRDFEQKLQKEFGEKQRELNRQMQEMMRKAGFAGGGLVIGAPPLPPGGLPPLPVQPGGLPPVGVGPFPGVGPHPGGIPPFGVRPDVERRLDELERKLDALLEKLGGKAPSRKPADPSNPPPRGGASDAPPAGAAPSRDPARPEANRVVPPAARP
ncbi:MAG: M48 family metalloprotease [Gemmataceae bacterium]|nr:M48 family metalloprotease [Gemmataceae bacterium]